MLQDIADLQNKYGNTRKRRSFQQVIKCFGEVRHNENQQAGGNDKRNYQHDNRVNHRRFNFSGDPGGFFQEQRQTVQHVFHSTGRFTGPNHVQVKFIKGFRMLRQSFGKCGTGFNQIGGFAQHDLTVRVLGLAFKSPQRADQRQAGVEQDGQLAGNYGQFFAFDDLGAQGHIHDIETAAFAALFGAFFSAGLLRFVRRFNRGWEKVLLFQIYRCKFFIYSINLTLYFLPGLAIHCGVKKTRHILPPSNCNIPYAIHIITPNQ